jgi:hypothetical protein
VEGRNERWVQWEIGESRGIRNRIRKNKKEFEEKLRSVMNLGTDPLTE